MEGKRLIKIRECKGFMKRMFLVGIFICLFCITEKASGELKFNPYEHRWEEAPADSSLKYNPYQKDWFYASPDSKP
jgi:hypothetical protein